MTAKKKKKKRVEKVCGKGGGVSFKIVALQNQCDEPFF